jgi:hypothetical protein
MARRDLATRRVEVVRASRLQKMHEAAHFVQKMWMGAATRKRYRELLAKYKRHENHVVTMQRYTRGFLVRLRMWREATRAEEELWAALEMQRCWRGYKGRVRFEDTLEIIWRREMAAKKLQPWVRGCLARAKISKRRRKIARVEFERARQRFRATQRIQACARGMIARRRVKQRAALVRWACTKIQARQRGVALRTRLWSLVVERRATHISKVVRGFLVRNRRFHLIAKAIIVQRHWRAHLSKPADVRKAAHELMVSRVRSAKLIQKHVRQSHEAPKLPQREGPPPDLSKCLKACLNPQGGVHHKKCVNYR